MTLSEQIRDKIIDMLELYEIGQGGGWVQPRSVGAHITSYPGSDEWHNSDQEYSDAAFRNAAQRLLKLYIEQYGKLPDGNLPDHVVDAYDETAYEIDALVQLAVELKVYT